VNFEQGLNASVKRLRQALNDSADNPRFVETLPRRGYRFIAPTQTVAAISGAPAAQAGLGQVESVHFETPNPSEAKQSDQVEKERTVRTAPVWKRSGIALLVVLGISMVWLLRPHTTPTTIRSLAVLPLENLSGDASQVYVSDGMTDELIAELGQISELRVISRTSAMTYKGSHESLPQIARDLKVDAVLEGAKRWPPIITHLEIPAHSRIPGVERGAYGDGGARLSIN
jgi:hypothetical protein